MWYFFHWRERVRQLVLVELRNPLRECNRQRLSRLRVAVLCVQCFGKQQRRSHVHAEP